MMIGALHHLILILMDRKQVIVTRHDYNKENKVHHMFQVGMETDSLLTAVPTEPIH